jgi:hypothetical protein
VADSETDPARARVTGSDRVALVVGSPWWLGSWIGSRLRWSGLLVGGSLRVEVVGLVGRWLLNCKGLRVRVAQAVVSHQFFTEKLSTGLSTGRAGLWITASQQKRTPPLAKSDRSGIYTPQQKIFAKVKAAIWPLTCGYIYCDEGHILKTRNADNFLPYI